MKVALGALLLVLGSIVWNPAARAERPKVLVQDLAAQGVEPHQAAVISTTACHAFAKSAAHTVLCGEDLRSMMRFSAMAATLDGCADADCFERLGKAMNARFVVHGSVAKLGEEYVLSLSMFDAEKGEPTGRSEIKAGSIEKLHAQVAEAVSAVLKRR
jgi:hypothetical protein